MSLSQGTARGKTQLLCGESEYKLVNIVSSANRVNLLLISNESGKCTAYRVSSLLTLKKVLLFIP